MAFPRLARVVRDSEPEYPAGSLGAYLVEQANSLEKSDLAMSEFYRHLLDHFRSDERYLPLLYGALDESWKARIEFGFRQAGVQIVPGGRVEWRGISGRDDNAVPGNIYSAIKAIFTDYDNTSGESRSAMSGEAGRGG